MGGLFAGLGQALLGGLKGLGSGLLGAGKGLGGLGGKLISGLGKGGGALGGLFGGGGLGGLFSGVGKGFFGSGGLGGGAGGAGWKINNFPVGGLSNILQGGNIPPSLLSMMSQQMPQQMPQQGLGQNSSEPYMFGEGANLFGNDKDIDLNLRS